MDATGLTIDVDRARDRVVVTLTGEIDIGNARDLAETFDAQLHEPGLLEVLIDVRGVRFLDSVGIGMLIRCRRKAELSETTLVLVARETDMVATLLRVTGLLDAFTIVSDLPTAARALT